MIGGPDTERRVKAERGDLRSDEDLVLLVAAGSVSAFDQLLVRYSRAVATLLDRTLHDRIWIEDLSQDTFVRVFRRASTFRPGMKFRPWLYAIALNLARDQNRRWAIWKRFLRGSRPREAAPPVPDTDRARDVRDALATLPEEFREALVLCELDGLSYAEAAEAAGTSPKTISSRLARAREKFRDAWRRRHPEEACHDVR